MVQKHNTVMCMVILEWAMEEGAPETNRWKGSWLEKGQGREERLHLSAEVTCGVDKRFPVTFIVDIPMARLNQVSDNQSTNPS